MGVGWSYRVCARDVWVEDRGPLSSWFFLPSYMRGNSGPEACEQTLSLISPLTGPSSQDLKQALAVLHRHSLVN